MKQLSVCVLFFCLSIHFRTAAQDPCEAPLKVLHQSLSVQSDRQLVEKLQYIYSATSSSEASTRNNSSLGLEIPDYGSGLWTSNKETINNVYNSQNEDINYQYSLDEKTSIYYTFYNSGDFAKAVDAWENCVTGGSRRLIVEANSKDQVIVSFKMASEDIDRNKKVKVRQISYTDNLELIKSSIPKNNKIPYSGEQTLTFKRKNINPAVVKVDLARGTIKPAVVKRAGPPPTTLAQATIYVDLSANMSANWLKTQYDNAQFTFPNQKRSHYILNVTNRKTNLSTANDARILSVWYEPQSGGIGKFEYQKSRVEDGKFVIDFHFISGAKKMTGKIGILYSYLKVI